VTCEEFDAFCALLPATTFVVQWGGAHVWKVGGKVFAIGGGEEAPAFTLKVTPLAFEVMGSAPGMRPAPYLALRGLTWLQRTDDSHVSDEELRGFLRAAHTLVARGIVSFTNQENRVQSGNDF
jgi:predicted DNA-binding protein (MmcQ/YjbR family)